MLYRIVGDMCLHTVKTSKLRTTGGAHAFTLMFPSLPTDSAQTCVCSTLLIATCPAIPRENKHGVFCALIRSLLRRMCVVVVRVELVECLIWSTPF